MKFFWCKTIDGTNTNFGDNLTPYILNHYNIEAEWDDKEPLYAGIGSLLHILPNETVKIWTSGFMYPTHHIKNECLAVRGKYSLRHTDASVDTPLGDGGLLLSRVFNPSPIKKFLLGILTHYVDDRQEDLSKYDIFKNPLVQVIKPYGSVEEIANQIIQCHFIISSSLHGIITSDSYKIPNALFVTDSSKVYIHLKQDSFKFRDYYSVWNEEFKLDETLHLTPTTTVEECISKCLRKPPRPNFDRVLDELEKSIELLYKH